MFSVVCGVRGGPLVQWNVSLFPTESYFLSCFHFSRWKDWFWLSCSFLFIPHWRPSTTSVQSEELWKHALFLKFFLFIQITSLQLKSGLVSSLLPLCARTVSRKKLQFHSNPFDIGWHRPLLEYTGEKKWFTISYLKIKNPQWYMKCSDLLIY